VPAQLILCETTETTEGKTIPFKPASPPSNRNTYFCAVPHFASTDIQDASTKGLVRFDLHLARAGLKANRTVRYMFEGDWVIVDVSIDSKPQSPRNRRRRSEGMKERRHCEGSEHTPNDLAKDQEKLTNLKSRGALQDELTVKVVIICAPSRLLQQQQSFCHKVTHPHGTSNSKSGQ
jgi:hypothetical protein